MDNLDILIGFFLIMLVFASGVSVAQSALKRLLSLKGEAIVRPLLAELEAVFRAQGPLTKDRAAWDQLKAQLRHDLTSWRSDLARQLIYASLKNRSEVVAALRAWGQDKLHVAAASGKPGESAASAASPENPGELAVVWEQAIGALEQRWDQLAARLSGSYERHTQFWVFALSLAVVATFHVDSIRIVRVLSVQPEVRRSAVELAQRRAQQAAKPTEAEVQPTLTSWQRDNVEDLQSAGLPLGWETAPLVVCGKAAERNASLSWTCKKGELNTPATLLLWLIRLIGLLISVGLIAQGAPFWYSLLDGALGARKKVLAITDRGELSLDPGSPRPVT